MISLNLIAAREEKRFHKALELHAWALSVDAGAILAELDRRRTDRRAKQAEMVAEMRAEQTRRALLEAQEKE